MPINKYCPWSGDKVQNDSLTHYKGHEVGFCNTGCRDKFDKAIEMFEREINPCDYGLVANFKRYAHYNQWMNIKLYKAIAKLSQHQYEQDMGAFFGSIKITLNHILVWDITWLQRMSEHSIKYKSLLELQDLVRPTSHTQIVHDKFEDLQVARQELDQTIINFCNELKEQDLNSIFSYRNLSGHQFNKNFGGAIQHVFNHQTHHRGQITTLLSQMKIDVGATDLLMILKEESNGNL